MQVAQHQVIFDIDPVLKGISDSFQPFAYEPTGDVYFDIVSMVVDQQIHYRSRQVYLKKLLNLLDGNDIRPELVLSLTPNDFANQKMAANKHATLIRLSEYWIENQLDNFDWQQASDYEIRNRLLGIKGIGEWTVDSLLLFTLERHDIFNPNDYQLKKAMMQAYGLSDDKKLLSNMNQIAERWMPYRSTGVLLMLSTIYEVK
jgi:DNA-3-methyladenine glycosylase II